MELLFFTITIILQYLIVSKIVKYTPIYQYDWIYNNKHLIKYDWFKKWRDFKGFNCQSCHTFWVSLILTYMLVQVTQYNILYMCPILLWNNAKFEDMEYFNTNNNVNVDDFNNQ